MQNWLLPTLLTSLLAKVTTASTSTQPIAELDTIACSLDLFLAVQNISQLDNSKLGSTQQPKICWQWHVARIISSQKIYGLYGLKHHIVEIGWGVTMRDGRTNERRTTEDRATQPMEAGGWVSQKGVFISSSDQLAEQGNESWQLWWPGPPKLATFVAGP